MDAITTANTTQTVSILRQKAKPPNSPMEAARQHSDSPDGCRSQAEGLNARTHVHSVEMDTETAADKTENVRTRRNKSRMQNSLNAFEIMMAKHSRRWRRVNIDDSNGDIPWNMPVAVIETASRIFVFGQVESRGEAIAPSVEGERAGSGGRNGGDGDGDDDGEGNTMNLAHGRDMCLWP